MGLARRGMYLKGHTTADKMKKVKGSLLYITVTMVNSKGLHS